MGGLVSVMKLIEKNRGLLDWLSAAIEKRIQFEDVKY